MYITIKKSQALPGMYLYSYLVSRTNCKFRYFKMENKFIAIAHRGQLDVIDLKIVNILEETKVPLWKQSMQLQMGQVPKQKLDDIRTCRLDQADLTKAAQYRFEVYEMC